MFLLTEGTLFFLDLAFSTRTRSQKSSLSSMIQKWIDGVAAATDDSADGPRTTCGSSSTLYGPCPVYLSCTVGQASPTSGDCDDSSESRAQNELVFSKTSFPASDEDAGETVLGHYDEVSIDTSDIDMMSSIINSDSDCCSLDIVPPSQSQQDVRRAVKRKIDDIDIEPGQNRDEDIEEPILQDARIGKVTTPSALPPKKKIKSEDAPYRSLGYVSAFTVLPRPRQRRLVDNECYLVEVIKKRSEYTTRDLPVPYDQRWSHAFISTALLWYSVQRNIWNVPKEELVFALQRIFNVVYPDVKYQVTATDSVFSLTLQRIDEWRDSFGSSALAMMMHFFSSLDDDGDRVRSAAEFLGTDLRFLRQDPDSSEPTELFRSPFLFVLLAITHLSDIAAFVNVPGWDTRAMAAGKGGESVIAIASTALQRAMTLFHDGTLDVNLLDEAAHCSDVSVPTSALPKTVLDTFARRNVPSALRFSSGNWSRNTAAYREAVRKRGVDFTCKTFAAAQAKRHKIINTGDDNIEVGACVSASGVRDPHALL